MATMNVTRYDGGGGGGGGVEIYGMSKVDKIMLKFRPIAPKPVSAGSGSGTDNSEGYVKCVRSKRKYVRVKKNTKKSKNNNDSGNKKRKVTLSLLPQTPARKQKFPDLVQNNNNNNISGKKTITQPQPVWVSFNNNINNYEDNNVGHGHVGGGGDTSVNRQVILRKTPFLPQVVSYVTVECVTDTWVDVQGLGCTDEERLMNLEKDTCPGFISDGQDRVVWTNKAYREMAAGSRDHDVAVVLVRKDTWNQSPPVMMYPAAFTCKVRASTSPIANSHGPISPTITLPCDGWRMERGGYAWRLDVKAALSLGR
uniref:uncharacterized protein LOC122588690 n=1 Tax=Erigeron canadensis TaxID=72917 RepID=UPI001CB985ED|nr:uncharacterized protein LOC122588690 [Erigeron canadensis]